VAPAYTSPGSRSTAAILALYVKVGACFLAIGADARRIVVAGELEDGRVLVDALLGADQLVTFAALLELLALVVAAVLVLRWQVTAHRNLPALGDAEPRFGVGSGVASWFVPGVNLVRPLQVVGDLWRAGERGAAVPALLRAWWAAWVVALLAVVAAWTLLGEAEDVADRQRIDALRAGATALSALAAGLAIAVVARTTSRQERRAVAVGAPRAVPATEPRRDDRTEGGLRVVSEDEARGRPPGE
jgi:hypothetical protein